VNLWVSGFIIALAASGAVALMALVRRYAPAGGFFTDLDRAAGVFGVIGTSFAVLLAFVIFVAFESYGNAKDKAGQEAVAVTELYHTTRLAPTDARRELSGEAICYARAVIDDEWPLMKNEGRSAVVEGWLDRFDASIARLDLGRRAEALAVGHWIDENATRREGRRGRLAEAAPFVPAPLWFALIVGAVVLVGFMCFFADPKEPFFVQAMMIGAVTAIILAGLLAIRFLDNPYEDRSGSIKPVEMTRTLQLMEVQNRRLDPNLRLPCDDRGNPTGRSPA
jgi:hypothetical protein